MKKSLSILVVLMVAATANATITGDFDGGTALNLPVAGTAVVVNQMLVDTDTEFLSAYLHIELSAGQCYNTASGGGDFEPDPVFVGFIPDLAYDTYLADPDGYPDLAKVPSAPAGVNNTMSTLIDASWYDDPNYPNGPGTGFRIAQLVFTPDAQGTVSGLLFDRDSAGNGVDLVGWSVVDGYIVPEPATMALLASGGICVLLRKKR